MPDRQFGKEGYGNADQRNDKDRRTLRLMRRCMGFIGRGWRSIPYREVCLPGKESMS